MSSSSYYGRSSYLQEHRYDNRAKKPQILGTCPHQLIISQRAQIDDRRTSEVAREFHDAIPVAGASQADPLGASRRSSKLIVNGAADMIQSGAHPIGFFSEWFTEPIVITDPSVAGVIDALNRHPLFDQAVQDYVMPIRRCREHPGRFRIYGENQDTYYCFVYEGDEYKIEPPVYYESCLLDDHGIDPALIIDGDHVLVADHFSDFLWQMLGHHVCLRLESGGHFKQNVTGIVFESRVKLNDVFLNPMGREFPAGYTCFVSDDVVCIPDWGAAFRTVRSRDEFIARYAPHVERQWP